MLINILKSNSSHNALQGNGQAVMHSKQLLLWDIFHIDANDTESLYLKLEGSFADGTKSRILTSVPAASTLIFYLKKHQFVKENRTLPSLQRAPAALGPQASTAPLFVSHVAELPF